MSARIDDDLSSNKMAAVNVQPIIQSWKSVNLPELQKELDETATELARKQDESDYSRKKLVELSRDFKKNTPEDVRKAVAPILKNFQVEIDSLSKRSKAAEVAFLAIYKKVLDLVDPLPTLERYISVQQKASKVSDLEIETKQLRETLKEYNQEFKSVKNQEVTIKQLREKIREYEDSFEQQIQQKSRDVEKELSRRFADKEKHLEDVRDDLTKKLHDAELRIASFQNALTNTQSELFELKSSEDENVLAKSDEMEMLMNDLDRANQRADVAEKRVVALKTEIETTNHSNFESQKEIDKDSESDFLARSSFHLEMAAKEKEISQLVVDIQQLQSTLAKEKELSDRKVAELEKSVIEKDNSLQSDEKELTIRKDYHEIKRELDILKAVEFSVVSETSISDKPLEILLLEKNKSLQSENTSLRLAYEEVNEKNKKLGRDHMEAISRVQDQQTLISQLEKDVSNIHSWSMIHRGEGEGQASPPIASELVAEAVKDVEQTGSMLSPIMEHASAAESLLPIVSSQRERFKQRNQELESQNSMQQQQINLLHGEIEQLRTDNIKLYEKIKFLQSFPSQRASYSDEMESRYSSQYEAKLDPFSSFGRKERQRKYMNLSPFEKITFSMGRAVLSNKIARTFAFIYTVLVHILIFLVLYKLAHTESCKRDVAFECHQKFSAHMHDVHGEALENSFAAG